MYFLKNVLTFLYKNENQNPDHCRNSKQIKYIGENADKKSLSHAKKGWIHSFIEQLNFWFKTKFHFSPVKIFLWTCTSLLTSPHRKLK